MKDILDGSYWIIVLSELSPLLEFPKDSLGSDLRGIFYRATADDFEPLNDALFSTGCGLKTRLTGSIPIIC